MPNNSSDSDEETVSGERPLHAIFGGGKVADILLWKNKISSIAFLLGFTLIWFLFEVMGYNFVTVMCNILIWMMVILFFLSTGAGLVGWDPPDLEAITIPESTFDWLCEKVNWLLLKFYEVSSGKDLKSFILAITFIWILSFIGKIFSSLNRLYIGFLFLMTVPALYEKYQDEVHPVTSKAIRNMINYTRNLIPRVLTRFQEGL